VNTEVIFERYYC